MLDELGARPAIAVLGKRIGCGVEIFGDLGGRRER